MQSHSKRKKQIRNNLVYSINESLPFSGEFFTLHLNGQDATTESYKDGKKDGEWVSWHEDGQEKEVHSYKDGKKDDEWGSWHEDGQEDLTNSIKHELTVNSKDNSTLAAVEEIKNKDIFNEIALRFKKKHQEVVESGAIKHILPLEFHQSNDSFFTGFTSVDFPNTPNEGIMFVIGPKNNTLQLQCIEADTGSFGDLMDNIYHEIQVINFADITDDKIDEIYGILSKHEYLGGDSLESVEDPNYKTLLGSYRFYSSPSQKTVASKPKVSNLFTFTIIVTSVVVLMTAWLILVN